MGKFLHNREFSYCTLRKKRFSESAFAFIHIQVHCIVQRIIQGNSTPCQNHNNFWVHMLIFPFNFQAHLF